MTKPSQSKEEVYEDRNLLAQVAFRMAKELHYRVRIKDYGSECPSCKEEPGIWRIQEVLEVRHPLSEDETSLFSTAGDSSI